MSEPTRAPRTFALPPHRRWAGGAVAAVGLPPLTALLVQLRGDLDLGSVLLLYVGVVVCVSAVGGLLPGLVSALAAFLLANYYLTPPYRTLVVESRDGVIALVVFLAVAVVVSLVVDVAARQRAAAARSEAEARALGRVAAEPLVARTAHDVLAEVAGTFALTSVELREQHEAGPSTVLARVGDPVVGDGTVSVDAGSGRRVVGDGRVPFAENRRLLGGLAHAAARAFDAERLAGEASRARELAEVDRLRSALLAAVSHDLRTPLAGIKAAVTTLRQDVVLHDDERSELLQTVEHFTDRLTDLVTNLLDLGRLDAGALDVRLEAVALDEVVARALLERHLAGVENEVDDDVPHALADAGLLERVVVNLADNACRHSGGRPVSVQVRARRDDVQLLVVDHGAGVRSQDWGRMFEAFDRLGASGSGSHAGLGLAIARGFTEAMGGTVQPSATDGGGLTMTVTLRRADRGAGA